MRRRNIIPNPRPRGPLGWTRTLVDATENIWDPPTPGEEAPLHLKATADADDAIVLIDSTPYSILPVEGGRYYTAMVNDLEIVERPAGAAGLFVVLLAFYDADAIPVTQVYGSDLPVGSHDGTVALLRNERAPVDGYAVMRVGSVGSETGEITEFYAAEFLLEPRGTVSG